MSPCTPAFVQHTPAEVFLFVPARSAVDELDVSACRDPIRHAFGVIINFSLLHALTKAVRLAALFGRDPSTLISLGR